MKFTIVCALAGISAAVSVSAEAEAEYNYIRDSIYDRLQATTGAATSNLSSSARSRTAKYLSNRNRDRTANVANARGISRYTTFNNRFSNKELTPFASQLTSTNTPDATTQTSNIYGCHWSPSKTYETTLNDYSERLKVNGIPTDTGGDASQWTKASNKNLTGYVGVECNTVITTGTPVTSCTFFAKAENFYFPRRALCSADASCSTELVLQLGLFTP